RARVRRRHVHDRRGEARRRARDMGGGAAAESPVRRAQLRPRRALRGHGRPGSRARLLPGGRQALPERESLQERAGARSEATRSAVVPPAVRRDSRGGIDLTQGRPGLYARAIRVASSTWFAWSTSVLLGAFYTADWLGSLWEIPLGIICTCCLIIAFIARDP